MTYEVMLYDVTVSKMIDSCYGLDLHSQYGQSTALVPSQNRFWAIILSSCYIMISLLHLLFWLHHIYPNSIHNSLLHHTLCPCTDFGTVHSGGPGAKKSNLDCIVSRHAQVTWRHAHGLLDRLSLTYAYGRVRVGGDGPFLFSPGEPIYTLGLEVQGQEKRESSGLHVCTLTVK